MCAAVGHLVLHTPFAKITQVACEGRMREARVGSMKNNLGSFPPIIGER